MKKINELKQSNNYESKKVLPSKDLLQIHVGPEGTMLFKKC